MFNFPDQATVKKVVNSLPRVGVGTSYGLSQARWDKPVDLVTLINMCNIVIPLWQLFTLLRLGPLCSLPFTTLIWNLIATVTEANVHWPSLNRPISLAEDYIEHGCDQAIDLRGKHRFPLDCQSTKSTPETVRKQTLYISFQILLFRCSFLTFPMICQVVLAFFFFFKWFSQARFPGDTSAAFQI